MARVAFGLAALVSSLALPLAAQVPAESHVVAGVAFDSLRGRPLSQAVVLLAGLDARDTTDDEGRFEFDSAPPGIVTVVVQHASLDSIGFPGLTRQLRPGAEGNVVIAVPSLQTLWAAACGGEPRNDSGFVFGTISSVDRGPVAGAGVTLSWIETTWDKGSGLRQRRHRAETTTDQHGTYVVCGVPMPQWFTLEANTESGERGAVSVLPHALRVERRNLLIAPARPDSAHLGAVEGVLLDGAGFPWSEARVILDDSMETRTSGDGRFAFHGVPSGTRQLQVLSLGMMPIVQTVDVYPGAPAFVNLQVRRVTTLDVVRVIGTKRGHLLAQELEERRLTGFGYTMDMTELASYSALEPALREVPGLTITDDGADFVARTSDGRGGQCVASVWVDGARMPVTALNIIQPREIMAIEVFPRPSTVPMQFRGLDRQTAVCGAVVLWTRWAFGR